MSITLNKEIFPPPPAHLEIPFKLHTFLNILVSQNPHSLEILLTSVKGGGGVWILSGTANCMKNKITATNLVCFLWEKHCLKHVKIRFTT